jgi:TetR/AcrR family transcriptional regulator, cholesterol catabolism regulator
MKPYSGKIVNMSSSNLNSSRRERKKEQTKQGLLQSAFKLFIEKGYDETTIEDIVNAADVAKVTFYYYFHSKEEIVVEMKRQTAVETLARAQKQLAENIAAVSVLQTMIDDLIAWIEQNWRMVEVFAAQRFVPQKGKELCGEQQTPPLVIFLEALIIHGQKTGEFRRELIPNEVAHFLALGLMNVFFVWMKNGRQNEALKASMQRCADFMLNGLLPKI